MSFDDLFPPDHSDVNDVVGADDHWLAEELEAENRCLREENLRLREQLAALQRPYQYWAASPRDRSRDLEEYLRQMMQNPNAREYTRANLTGRSN